MGKADGLSRRPDWKVGVDRDNENQVVIKELEVDIVERIKKARSKNEDVVRVVEEMKRTKIKELRKEEWKIEGELVLKEGKVYIPRDEELRAEVIRLHHNILAAGYGRQWKMVELVTRNY